VTPNDIFFLWMNLERTLDKQRRKVGVVRRRQLKKGYHSTHGVDKKGHQFFKGKKPSVAAPGDTNPSNATDKTTQKYNDNYNKNNTILFTDTLINTAVCTRNPNKYLCINMSADSNKLK